MCGAPVPGLALIDELMRLTHGRCGGPFGVHSELNLDRQAVMCLSMQIISEKWRQTLECTALSMRTVTRLSALSAPQHYVLASGIGEA